MDIKAFFRPRSVTVIGASTDPAKLGHIVLRNIKDGGYPGTLTAVNPKGGQILDLPAYPDVHAIPEAPELAVLAIPAAAVPAAIAACGEAGVSAVIVIAAGFGEVGEDGAEREAELRELAARFEMRLLGPNCLGIIDPINKLNASFAGAMPRPGQIAVFSQSGAMCTALLDWAAPAGLGFSQFVSIGNQADLTAADLLETWSRDSQTKTVLGYLEGIKDGRRFLDAAARLTRQKPCVLIKAGVSAAGAAAVGSHTGALTGADDVLAAALRRVGITRAASVEELFDFTTAFAGAPLPAGPRLAVVTNAGGPGVIATDAAAAAGLTMAELAPKTRGALANALPAEANITNPVDCVGDARADRYQHALAAVLADRQVDAVVVLLTPQAMTEIPETAEVIIAAAKQSDKPVLAGLIGGAAVAAGAERLQRAGLPVYPTPERAINAFRALNEYAAYRRSKRVPDRAPRPEAAAAKVLEATAQAKQVAVWGSAAADLVAPYGIKAPRVAPANHAEAAVSAAKKIGFPVALKIDSPDVLHKTDAGGVVLDRRTPEEVREAYTEMTERIARSHPKARLNGVTVSTMVPDGHDFLVGAKRDAVFGPVVVFGYGGIYVEVFKDVAFGLAPLNLDQALALINDTKAAALLNGVRGDDKLDRRALAKAVVGVSQLVTDFPEIQELDLNPIRVFAKGALALDVRVMLGDQ